ncbi:tetratricopeptide repeat protein [Lentzea tibetensis]|uniref:Tetratricopeptide repeat protein n=1 Tax=Lentzea tibetensis TaxID=2591470 RepID=A0A563EXE5_9PSEU|nr:tetratricopeptide repeat protein [Lentzea tibetensis]
MSSAEAVQADDSTDAPSAVEADDVDREDDEIDERDSTERDADESGADDREDERAADEAGDSRRDDSDSDQRGSDRRDDAGDRGRDRDEESAPVRGRAPELPEDADISLLDPEIRGELRSLPKGLAEIVGRHLAAAGLLIDSEPELALEHARHARSKAARVGVVREAAGLTAYFAGEWAEALSELRAARRMTTGTGHLAIMADCERALGRPERAIELAREAKGLKLPDEEAVELRIVAAGARRDMGQLDAAVVALQGPDLDPGHRTEFSARLFYAYADNLAAAGRTEEAVKWFLNAAEADDEGETDAAERAFELTEDVQDAGDGETANDDAESTEDAGDK